MKLTQLIHAALREDIGTGDITSRLLIPAKASGHAVILAKESGIFCGEQVVHEIFTAAGRKIKIRFLVKDGRRFSKGATLVKLHGPIRSILAAERTVLNFSGHLCGVATRTQEFVRRVRKYRVRILDTRKTTPLWRALEKKAVKCGGGWNHRMGLYDAIFVKENHRPYGDSTKLRNKSFEIEVRNQRELTEALLLRPRVILFDNFKPSALKTAVAMARRYDKRIVLEASGGVTVQNVAAYARTGVDQISIGSLTRSVKAIDLSLLVRKGGRGNKKE